MQSSTCYEPAENAQALDQTELCAHSTAHDRFQAWVEAGLFLKLWQAGVEQFDELCGIDWDWLTIDGAMAKAPLGGEKTGSNPCTGYTGHLFAQTALARRSRRCQSGSFERMSPVASTKRQFTSSRLLPSRNIAILPLVPPMYVLSLIGRTHPTWIGLSSGRDGLLGVQIHICVAYP